MSAICGVWHLDGRPANWVTLRPVMDASAHYGGDGHGTWFDGAVGCGHHMRHITPESTCETLPYTRGPLTITADARIDNREDLFAALAIPHDERASLPDSALILRAYARWGTDCAQRLIGDFAFAIWDAQARRLFCVRDHIGARPLFYYRDHRVFAFASDIRALLAFEDVPAAIDEDEVARLLVNPDANHAHPVRTSYRDIVRLPFAHALTVSASGDQTQWPYWTPPPANSLHLPNETAYIDQALDVVQQAVTARLRTTFPVGAHLSGGMDSSGVSVLAARHLRAQGRDLPVYSWSPPPGTQPDPKSEQARIEAICREEGLMPRYVPTPPPTLYSRISLAAQRLDAESDVMAAAVADGVRVMLSGWGGDEFISFNARGYRADLFASGRWLALLNSYRLRPLSRARLKRIARSLWHDVALVLAPDRVYWRYYRNAAALTGEMFITGAIVEKIRALQAESSPERYQIRGRYANQQRLYAYGHLTERIEHWGAGGAPHGITYVYPLLDRRVMEFAFALPDRLYLRHGMDRYIFRQAMARIFPPGMAFERVKAEPAMLAHARAVLALAEHNQRRVIEALAGCDDVPWVDLSGLRRALAQPYTAQPESTQFAIRQALDAIALWQALHR